MTVAWVEIELFRQIKAESHSLAIFGDLDFCHDIMGRDLGDFYSLRGNIQNAGMRHKSVVFGNHADRDETLVFAERQSDYHVEESL